MPNVLKIDRPRKIELSLPTTVFAKMEIELYDADKQRVPFGAYSRLYEKLVKDWLEARGVIV